MQLQSIDNLIFKGTHNSFQCHISFNNPVMNHPINVQIDDFGVWAIELDVGAINFNPDFIRPPDVVVGENNQGDKACFVPDPYYLESYFRQIKGARSLNYRPILVYFDIKDWTESYDNSGGFDGIRAAAEWGVSIADSVFDHVVVLSDLVSTSGYPTLRDIQPGTIIIYYPSPEYAPKPDGSVKDPGGGTLQGITMIGCTSAQSVEDAINKQNSKVILLDLYQADWTFDYGVPPNPIVVDTSAQLSWTVTDSSGDSWDCDGGERWNGQVVGQHGTFRFPYGTVGAAVDRAKAASQGFDSRRTGYGWTILLKPGTYPESVTIDIPLRLEKDPFSAGTVVIGR